jgi:hypothetical protein
MARLPLELHFQVLKLLQSRIGGSNELAIMARVSPHVRREAERMLYTSVNVFSDLQRIFIFLRTISTVPRLAMLVQSLTIVTLPLAPTFAFYNLLHDAFANMTHLSALDLSSPGLGLHGDPDASCKWIFAHSTFRLVKLCTPFVFDRHFTSFLQQQSSIQHLRIQHPSHIPKIRATTLPLLSVLEVDSNRHYAATIICGRPITHVRLNGLNGTAREIDITRIKLSTRPISVFYINMGPHGPPDEYSSIQHALWKPVAKIAPYLRHIGGIEIDEKTVCNILTVSGITRLTSRANIENDHTGNPFTILRPQHSVFYLTPGGAGDRHDTMAERSMHFLAHCAHAKRNRGWDRTSFMG